MNWITIIPPLIIAIIVCISHAIYMQYKKQKPITTRVQFKMIDLRRLYQSTKGDSVCQFVIENVGTHVLYNSLFSYNAEYSVVATEASDNWYPGMMHLHFAIESINLMNEHYVILEGIDAMWIVAHLRKITHIANPFVIIQASDSDRRKIEQLWFH